MATYDNQGNPVIRFRLKPYLIEILTEIGKEKLISPDLVAKGYVLDHMINLKLIPKKLIPQLIKDITSDYLIDIQRAYNLTDKEMEFVIKKSGV